MPRVHLVRHVRELVAPAVGDDHDAASLDGLQVVGHLRAEELRCVQRGLADRHGRGVGLHALHDALDGLARKLSLFDFAVRRHTPWTGHCLPVYLFTTRANSKQAPFYKDDWII